MGGGGPARSQKADKNTGERRAEMEGAADERSWRAAQHRAEEGDEAEDKTEEEEETAEDETRSPASKK
jgi:hypothetical protein